MKNKFIIIIMLLILILPFNKVLALDKINVYIFEGEECPHCKEAISYFDSLSSDENYNKYFNLIKYEVWHNKDNLNLMNKICDKLDITNDGVPLILIGDDYFYGYTTDDNDEIIDTIIKQYNNKNYIDLVKNNDKIIKKNDVKTIKNNSEDKIKESNNKINYNIFILLILVAILIILILYIIFNKNRKISNLHIKS